MNFPMMPAPKLPEGLPKAWLLDCDIFAESIRPDADVTVTQWAEQNRILPPETSAEPGPWRTARVPHTREIMDVLSPIDPTQEVTWVAGTQVSKTEVGNNFIGTIIDKAPGPTMMVYPTSNTGKRSSRTRLSTMIESTPCLRGKISDRARDKSNSASLKEFPGGVLVVAGSNSAAELKSMPVRFLFEDEVDEYPDDVDGQGPADKLAEKRTDTFPRKKIYRTSTPTERGRSKIWKHWLRSDMRRYFVPCPHCDVEQVLKWDQFRWEVRRVWELVDAEGVIANVAEGTEGARPRETGQLVDVWYECEHCRTRIDEHEKTEMFARGRWIAEHPEVKGHAGFHLPAFYSPLGWFGWRQVVADRLEADRDPSGELMKNWANTVAAEPFVNSSEQVSDTSIKERAENYKLGAVPMGGLLLTASADVQADRLEVKVKAWGRGEESWLIDYQVMHGDTETSAPWDMLDEYLTKKFAHESGADLRIVATAVDAGYRTQTVFAWCRTKRHRNIFPVRGQSQPGKTILGRPTEQDVDHRGAKIPRGVQLWPIGADTAKSKIYARLKITTAGPGCMHFPLGLADDYYKGLTAERLVARYHHGFIKRVWEKDAGARNEPLDLEVYAYAAAIYAGVTRINWDRLEAGLHATAGDLFVNQQAKERREAAAAAPEESSPPPEAEPNSTPAPVAKSAPAQWLPRRNDWLQKR